MGEDRRQFVPLLLIIVSRAKPAQQAYLKHVFGSQTEDVILDRRVGERRERLARAVPERRCSERRQRDITNDLQVSGWALVRR